MSKLAAPCALNPNEVETLITERGFSVNNACPACGWRPGEHGWKGSVSYPWESKYLDFVELDNHSRKTRIIEVRAKSSGVLLGTIKWLGRWRQYCFWPAPETIFNWDCLDHVKSVLGFLNAEPRD